MDRYQYQKLNEGAIRLLRFCSNQAEELSFEIQHHELDEETPPYAALSYTWGKAIFPHRIVVGNSFLPITENLRDALLHIRQRKTGKSKPRIKFKFLWVDAACINQSNDNEKASQISLMTRLYSQADQVYVWLGLPNNDTHMCLAMAKLDYFYKRAKSSIKNGTNYKPWWWPTGPTYDPKISHTLSKLPANNKNVFDVEGTKTHAAWLGIVEIWQNPWWNRTWILQEATVEENNRATVLWTMCGVWTFMPRYKVRFFCGQYSTRWAGDPSQRRGSGQPGIHATSQDRLPESPELLELLQLFRHSECLDPRDKVYSLLGLAPDSFRSRIIPEPRRDVVALYADVVRYALSLPTPDLNFLGYTMRLDNPRRTLSTEISHAIWPSWLPNWDDPLLLYPLTKGIPDRVRDTKNHPARALANLRRVTPLRSAFTIRNAYNATGTSSAQASITGHQLSVKGIRVDTLVDLFSFYDMSWDQRRAKCNAWSAKLDKKYPTNESFSGVLARVQVADVNSNISGNPISRNNAANNDLLGKPRAQLTPDELNAQSSMRIALSRATAFRGVCLTQQGYLGLVPISARVGDSVCALLGGQVLYVLRADERARQGNNYQYIGECYVHGLMDGQVMSWVQEGRVTIDRFVLV